MSADELRQAAETLRYPYRCNTPVYELALADWLDLTATTPAFRAFEQGRSGSHVSKNIHAALAVARLINGGES